MTSHILSVDTAWTARLSGSAAVLLVGAVFVFVAGLPQPDGQHHPPNAIRHAMSFPCH